MGRTGARATMGTVGLRMAGAAVLAAGLLALPDAAEGTPSDPHAGATAILTGDFDGDGWGDVFVHRAGRAPDTVAWGPDRMAVPMRVDGSYRPFAGDLTGDGRDEIFWYAPGPAGDVVWRWDGRTPRPTPMSIDGTYEPVTGDFDGDRRDDILWYAPGAGPDPLWLARRGALDFDRHRTTVNGTYRIAAGDVDGDGRDDLVLHGPGPAPDHISRFGPGLRLEHRPVTIDGDHRVVVGSFGAGAADDVLLVGPGGSAELWSDPGTAQATRRRIGVPANRSVHVARFGRDDRDDVLFAAPSGVAEVWFGDDDDLVAIEDDSVRVIGDSLAAESAGHFVDAVGAVGGEGVRGDVQAFPGMAPCDHLDLADRTHARSVILSYVGNAFTPCMGDVGHRGRAAILARYDRDVRAMIRRLSAASVENIVLAGPPDLRHVSLADMRALYARVADDHVNVTYRPVGEVLHERGRYAETLPCRPFEHRSMGCAHGRIRVRSDDGVHLCPGPACPPTWSSGAHRYGSALADAVLASRGPIPG